MTNIKLPFLILMNYVIANLKAVTSSESILGLEFWSSERIWGFRPQTCKHISLGVTLYTIPDLMPIKVNGCISSDFSGPDATLTEVKGGLLLGIKLFTCINFCKIRALAGKQEMFI